eukprot:2607119-Karenia_brevis.AAC.1
MEGVPDPPPSPIDSPEGPVSPDASFLDAVGEGGAGGEVATGVAAQTQYPVNMVAEPSASSTGPVGAAAPTQEVQTVEFEEKSMKVVALTVKHVIGKLIPQLQRPQYENVRRETVDDKRKVCLDEKYFRRMETYASEEWKRMLETPFNSECGSST